MKLNIMTALLLAILGTAPASATPLANAFHRQQVSIGRGLADGSLRPGEAIQLDADEPQARRGQAQEVA